MDDQPMLDFTAKPPVFNAAESERHKIAGIERAAEHNARRIIEAREIAVDLAQHNGTVTADDVMVEWLRRGGKIHDFGNSMGSLFRDKRFAWTGRMVKSTRIHAHSNLLKEWQLVPLTSEQKAGAGSCGTMNCVS